MKIGASSMPVRFKLQTTASLAAMRAVPGV